MISLDEYASFFKDIDPVSQYKNWTTMSRIDGSNTLKKLASTCDLYTEKVKAAFIVSDPVDWGRDIQVILYCSRRVIFVSEGSLIYDAVRSHARLTLM